MGVIGSIFGPQIQYVMSEEGEIRACNRPASPSLRPWAGARATLGERGLRRGGARG